MTTSMDELSHRNDRLIHFLRKQVHIEGNNTLIDLTRKIFYFWYDGDLSALKRFVPADVYDAVDLEERWFKPVHNLLRTLCHDRNCLPEKFLNMDHKELATLLASVPDVNEIDRKRFHTSVTFMRCCGKNTLLIR